MARGGHRRGDGGGGGASASCAWTAGSRNDADAAGSSRPTRSACRVRVGAPDATVLGAAMLAGVGAGVFASVEEAAALLPAGRVVEPRHAAQERARRGRAGGSSWRQLRL